MEDPEEIQDYLTTLKATVLNRLAAAASLNFVAASGPPAYLKQKPHSALSPLSHSSPLYPNGLLTPLWLERHLTEVFSKPIIL